MKEQSQMASEDGLHSLNKRTYARADVIDCYKHLDKLQQVETILFEKVSSEFGGKRILDIGIGGCRTTAALRRLSKDYTGIDYIPQFVEAARKRFTDAAFLLCDARDLSILDDERFDFVLFAFNGIDYVNHEDRKKVLSEIHRVLKSGGLFMFSTHNRDYKGMNKLPWQEGIRLNLSYLKLCLYCLYYLPRHNKMKRNEVHTREYSIINDVAHQFSLLTYYIGIAEQTKQLTVIGFRGIESFDLSGKKTTDDINSQWIYYLARK